MQYNPPTNGDLNNPNRSYVNADPSNGIPGSYPSAESIEHPMREIVKVITDADFVPDGNDLTQLSAAIKKLIASGGLKPSIFRHLQPSSTVANNGLDAANDIDISAGYCLSDDLSTFLHLEAGIIKRLDANWSAGSNGGGLDTGVKAANTTYHVFQIYDPVLKSCDVLFSTSLAPVMPQGFTKKRRIASLSTNSSGAFIPFMQNGNEFRFVNPSMDVNTGVLSTAPSLYALPVPAGLKLKAVMSVFIRHPATDTWGLISDPDLNFNGGIGQPLTAVPFANIGSTGASGIDGKHSAEMSVYTNASRQIRAVSAHTNTDLKISTQAYIDDRRI